MKKIILFGFLICSFLSEAQNSVSITTIISQTPCPAGINALETNDVFQLFPNPVNNELTIEFNSTISTNTLITIVVVNMLGKTVLTTNETIASGKIFKTKINTAFLPDGTYFVKMETTEKMYYRPLIITHNN